MRTWAVCLGAYLIACTNALACAPSTERGILFEHLPTDLDAPVIIEATIYEKTQVGDAVGNQIMLMTARVDRVIKGSIDTKTLKIFVGIGSCTRAGLGQGIILGTFRDDPLRGVMLEAVEGAKLRGQSKEFLQQQTDLWERAKCVANKVGLEECHVDIK